MSPESFVLSNLLCELTAKMQPIHLLTAFIFLSQTCAGVVYPEARTEYSLVPVAIEDTEDVALVDAHSSRETSLDVRSTDSSLATVSWSFSGGKFMIGLTLFLNAFVFAGVCIASSTIACAVAAGYTVFTAFFAKWTFKGRSLSEVDDLGTDSEMYLTLPPTPEKSHRQRLATELEPGTWHTVGTMRVGMFNHTIHYHNDGTGIHTLRAWQRMTTTGRWWITSGRARTSNHTMISRVLRTPPAISPPMRWGI